MKEKDIRPKKILDNYIKLSAEDAVSCFEGQDHKDIPCVACGCEIVSEVFTKNGFSYAECHQCRSLFQTPRASLQSFESFYQRSKSSQYWAEVFYPAVAESRRDKIIVPKVKEITRLCSDVRLEVENIIDAGAGYGIFLEEWIKTNPSVQAIAIEPSPALAEICRMKGIEVVEDIAENVSGLDAFADLLVCFEVLEHVYNPLEFIQNLKSMIRPGGYLFISTLSIDGFDLQVLWDKSSQISPPHHINFLSLKGFEELFSRAGFSEILITTPGKLDVDIVRNAINNEVIDSDENRFIDKITKNEQLAQSFQSYLANNKLSSHAWVLAKLPN